MTKPQFDISRTHSGHLTDLCPLVDGAIVSRPLIDAGGCRQILFAMDVGQEMSQHQAPFPATVQVLDGRLDFRCGEDRFDMGPLDWLSLPPNEPHSVRATAPARFLLTLAKGAT